MRALGLRQRFRRALSQLGLHGPPLSLHLSQAKLGCSRAGDHDEIDPVRQQIGPSAKALPAEPLHAVASHGRADRPGDDEAESRRAHRRRLSRDEEREVRRAYPSSRPLRLDELPMPAQPSPLGELEAQTRRLLFVNRGHQTSATLAAAILQHFAAAPCRHPCTKAMGARPANVVRLVGTLHDEPARKHRMPLASS